MSEVVGEALYVALRGPKPVSAREVVSAFGGPAATARVIAGVKPGVAPRDMPAEVKRRYDNARRQAARWVQVNASVRDRRTGGFAKLDPAVRGRLTRRAWRVQFDRRVGVLVEKGARARLYATVTVDTPTGGGRDVRHREMPSGGPAVLLTGAEVALFSEPLQRRRRDVDLAGERFLDAFFASYGGGLSAQAVEVDEIDDLALWPEGEPEGDNW